MDNESELTNQGKIEHEIDLDSIKPSGVIHNFVQRGDVISCETNTHPTHRHFKTRTDIHSD